MNLNFFPPHVQHIEFFSWTVTGPNWIQRSITQSMREDRKTNTTQIPKYCFPIHLCDGSFNTSTGCMNKYRKIQSASECVQEQTGLTHILFSYVQKRRGEKTKTQIEMRSDQIRSLLRIENRRASATSHIHTQPFTQLLHATLHRNNSFFNWNHWTVAKFKSHSNFRRNACITQKIYLVHTHSHTHLNTHRRAEAQTHGAPMHKQHYKYLYTCFKFSWNRLAHKVQVRKNTAERARANEQMNRISCHVWEAREAIVCRFLLHERKLNWMRKTNSFTLVVFEPISISCAFSAPFCVSCSYISISFRKWVLDWCHYRLCGARVK